MLDGWRLAVGTLTAIPVRPPSVVDRRTARTAMLLAPLAVVPLGIVVWLVCRYLHVGTFFVPVAPVVAIALLTLGDRAFHLDGLSDVADGLAASYDKERSLAVMKTGASGPAGTAAVVLVLLAQVLGLAGLSVRPHGEIAAGVLVCLSRCALVVTCARGVPGAREDGIGAPFVGCVPRSLAALVVVVLVAAAGAATWWANAGWANADDGWGRGLLTGLVAVGVLGALLWLTIRRFGGVTGDVFGAAIELTLAVLLVGASGGQILLAG